MNISLISNSLTWQIEYDTSEKPKLNAFKKIAGIFFSAVAWPFCVMIGSGLIVYDTYKYAKHSLKQSKMVKVLKNNQLLSEYSNSRAENNRRKLDSLKKVVSERLTFHFRSTEESPLIKIERTSKPTHSGLQSMLKRFNLPSANKDQIVLDRLSANYWKSLKWDDYFSNDFIKIAKGARDCDETAFQILHRSQVKYQKLSTQIDNLTNCDDEEQAQKVKKIAQLSFVKHGIKKQVARKNLSYRWKWLLPAGAFWVLYYKRNDEKQLFENKKEHLKALPSLNAYKDLIDAHNQLIKEQDDLIPYCQDNGVNLRK